MPLFFSLSQKVILIFTFYLKRDELAALVELLTDKETFARTVSQEELEEEDSMQVDDDDVIDQDDGYDQSDDCDDQSDDVDDQRVMMPSTLQGLEDIIRDTGPVDSNLTSANASKYNSEVGRP